MSDREPGGWDDHPGEFFPPPIAAPLPPKPKQKLAAALLAGGAAAVLGGIAWGLVVKWTGYEAGILALGVGLLAAFAVYSATGGRRGPELQAVAVGGALLGIAIGKYLGFAFEAREVFPDIALLSAEMLRLFRDALHDILGLFDLLWIALAAAAAWIAL